MSEREIIGQGIMMAALQYGYVEIKPEIKLYSAAGIEQLALKLNTGELFDTTQAPFYFIYPGRIEEVFEPLDIADFLEQHY